MGARTPVSPYERRAILELLSPTRAQEHEHCEFYRLAVIDLYERFSCSCGVLHLFASGVITDTARLYKARAVLPPTPASRADQMVFIAAVPLLCLALVAAAAGEAIRRLPKDVREHWDNLNKRGR